MVMINHMEVLNGKAAIVEIEGELNSTTFPDLEEYINLLIEKEIYHIMFDAAKLESVSSEGIGLTLFIQKKLEQKKGFLVIFNLSEEISSLYRLLGFDKIFVMASSKIDAMQIMDREIEQRYYQIEEDSEDIIYDKDDKGIAMPEREDTDNLEYQGFNKEIKPDIKAEEAAAERKEIVEFEPIVIECSKCKSLIRVKKSGGYLCPTCNTEFYVDNDQTARFI